LSKEDSQFTNKCRTKITGQLANPGLPGKWPFKNSAHARISHISVGENGVVPVQKVVMFYSVLRYYVVVIFDELLLQGIS